MRKSNADYTPLWIRIFKRFMILLFISISVICIVYSLIFYNALKNDNMHYIKNQLYTLSENINNFLGHYRFLTDNILVYEKIDGAIQKKHASGYGETSGYRADMNRALTEIYSGYDKMNAIAFVDNDGERFIVGGFDYKNLDILLETYKEKLDRGKGSMVWGYYEYNGTSFICVMRMVNRTVSSYRFSKIGYIAVLVREENLYERYGMLENIDGANILITDDENDIVSALNRSMVGSSFGDIYHERNAGNVIDRHGVRYYRLRQSLPINNWRLTYLVSAKSIFAPIFVASAALILIALVAFVFCTIISYTSAKKIGYSLLQLAEQIREVISTHDYTITAETDLGDEVSVLYDSFNEMTKALNSHINQNLNMQIRIKDALIKEYERQISPHFLYNTLEMIRMMAVLGENNSVEEAVLCLNKVLRFSLIKDKEVYLKDELDSVEKYLRILKMRYNDDFSYEIIAPDDLKGYYVLKNVLQPLIENSVTHGLSDISRSGKIRVLARKIEDNIVIVVEDNGKGLSAAELEKIRQKITVRTPSSESGIGLNNVNQRIKLLFGEDYGMEIYSTLGVKTDVIITMPAYTEKDDDSEKEGADV